MRSDDRIAPWLVLSGSTRQPRLAQTGGARDCSLATGLPVALAAIPRPPVQIRQRGYFLFFTTLKLHFSKFFKGVIRTEHLFG